MNTKVVKAIDEFLDYKRKRETTPVEVAPYLEKKGILTDSKHRPGKPLRDLLRNGQIPNVHQNGNRWIIRRSDFKAKKSTETTDSKSSKSPIPTPELNDIKIPDPTSTTDKISWAWCQQKSNIILLSGLSSLTSRPHYFFDHNYPSGFGNYLITDGSKKWKYIGESNNLVNRIKQHGQLKTSTFYKNYNKAKTDHLSLPQDEELHTFRVQCISTYIGRKELEEFGIVNLPCNLNRFQLGKRDTVIGDIDSNVWNTIQHQADRLLKDGQQAIANLDTVPWDEANAPDSAGIYWIEHPEDGLIYIGKSSNIAMRYNAHSDKTYFSAFRRNTAVNLLDFTLKVKNGKRRYLSEQEEASLGQYISECSIKMLPISFGRFELEELLIQVHQPLLNRKGTTK